MIFEGVSIKINAVREKFIGIDLASLKRWSKVTYQTYALPDTDGLPSLIKLLLPSYSIERPFQRCPNCERTYQVIHSYHREVGIPLWPIKCPHCGYRNSEVENLIKEGLAYLRASNLPVEKIASLENLKACTEYEEAEEIIRGFKKWVVQRFRNER